MSDTRFKACLGHIAVAFLLSLFIILMPVMQEAYARSVLQHELIVTVCAFVIGGLSLGMLLLKLFGKNDGRKWDVTTIDISVIVYLLYGLLNLVLNSDTSPVPIVVVRWGAVLCGYWLVRALNAPGLLLWAVVISGTVQSLLALGQHFHLLGEYNPFFMVKGSFSNPGQLGGYLCVAFIISVGLFIQAIRYSTRRALYAAIPGGIIGIALVLSDSRAAWLATIIAVMVLFYRNRRQIRLKVRLRRTLAVMTIIIIIAGCVGGYLYKRDSADGRLLIWRVSADMIAEKPLGGHGVSSFAQKYMTYQGNYFESHPDSEWGDVADDVLFSFNEYIRLAVEQGIAGLLCLLVLLWLALSGKEDDRNQETYKTALVTLAVFSMFSYPAAVFPLLFLFVVILGSLSGKELYSVMVPRWIYMAAIPVIVVFMTFSIKAQQLCTNIPAMIEASFKEKHPEKRIKEYHSILFHPIVNDLYLHWMVQTGEDTLTTDLILPSYRAYLTLGRVYYERGQYDAADRLLEQASHIVPSRLSPDYYLWRSSLERGDTIEAVELAGQIISKGVKIENTFTLRAKEEARRFLTEQNKIKN